MDTKMKVYDNIEDFIQQLTNYDTVALSAPLHIQEDSSVIIGYYSPTGGQGSIHLHNTQPDSWADLYTGKYFRLAVHGLKRIREHHQLRDLDVHPDRVIDTKLMAHLLDPGRDEDHGYHLNHLAHEYEDEYPVMTGNLFASDYPEFLYQSPSHDAELIYRLAEALNTEMDYDLCRLYKEVEFPVSDVLLQMHLDGIQVDQGGCQEALEQAQRELESLDAEIALTRKCNLYSDKDVYWLFRNRGIELPEGVGDYYRLDQDDLEELANDHNSVLAEQILSWRRIRRDLSFLEAGSKTDRVHAVWRLTRTATGRITASNPPVQNLDKKRYRPFLVPADGCVIIKADWKACQARILAHLSEDPGLVKLFNEGKDFHAATAQMFGLASREEAKPINFGMIFGQRPRALAREVNKSWKEQKLDKEIDEAQAADMIRTFFDNYSGIEPYFKREYETLVGVKKLKKILRNPLTGRIRRFRMRESDKLKRIMKATLLQQVESHLLTLALINLHSELIALGASARIVMAVHDSIWVEAPKHERSEVRKLMEHIMITVGELEVSLEVEFSE
jgi:DNA polymerase I